jgi:hypothetical protein
MSIIDLYRESLQVLEQAFHELECRLERPAATDLGFGTAWRYQSQSLEAAIIQKLARVVSGLNACIVLLEKGLVQELGALQRMLDEFCEDLFFLCDPLIGGERTPLHDKYLKLFYQEELDAHGIPFLSKQNRPQIPRKRIQAAIARMTASLLNPSDGQEMMRTLSSANSGFVHGASPHIMEMCWGNPPCFHVSGMLGTPRIEEFTDSQWNYFHRGLNIAGLVAAALRDRAVMERILEYRGHFERDSGRSADGNASEMMARVKAKFRPRRRERDS